VALAKKVLFASCVMMSCGLAKKGDTATQELAPAPLTLTADSVSFTQYCQSSPADPIVSSVLAHLFSSPDPMFCAQAEARLAQVQQLNLRGRGIESLETLRYLTNLLWLDLGENPLQEVHGLSHLVSLEALWLDNSSLGSTAPLAALLQLRSIDLRNTEITRMEGLSALSQLQKLNISQNTLEDVHFLSRLVNLRWLSAASVGLTQLQPIVFLTRLQYLDLRDNLLEDLSPLAKLPDLLSLDAMGNPLSNLPQDEVTCPTQGDINPALRSFCRLLPQ
jgi:Leucine-rich repeat (LRR) protein